MLANRLRDLDPSFFLKQSILKSVPMTFRVFAEGKTDHAHLRAALAYFNTVEGRFTDLKLIHDTTTTGDQDLYRRCEAFATVAQPTPMVFVFDRDNPEILPKVTDRGAPFKDWGNDVFSLALPIPAHRKADEQLCIEMLYADDVLLRRDGGGRRLYLKNEFDQQTGIHPTENVVCQNIKARALVREEDVFDLTSHNKVSLSKQAFATAIGSKEPPFEGVTFEGFRGLMELLDSIRVLRFAK